MKFKVGDKVRVKNNSKLDGGKYAGKVGTVEAVCRKVSYPYDVELEGFGIILFCANELEEVKDATPKEG